MTDPSGGAKTLALAYVSSKEGEHRNGDARSGEFHVLATLRRSGSPYSLSRPLYTSPMITPGGMTARLETAIAMP